MHNRFDAGDAGFASAFDFDSAVAGVQTLSVSALNTLAIQTGGGNDTVVLGTPTVAATSLLVAFQVNNSGANGDRLIIDDSARTTPSTIDVTSEGYSGSNLSIQLVGSAFDGGRDLRTGSGADTIRVLSVLNIAALGAEPINIFSGNGDDVISVGSASNILEGFETQIVSIDGGGGNDAVVVNDSGNNLTVGYLIEGPQIRRTLDGINAATIVTTSTVEQRIINGSQGENAYSLAGSVGGVTVNAGSLGDLLDARGVLPGSSIVTLNGGDGTDHLLGSDGTDFLIGGKGNDFMFGGDGADGFSWSQGDGNDLIEGGSGSDVLEFNGANANDVLSLSAFGSRLKLSREAGSVNLDVADVEELDLNTLDGNDQVNVGDLSTTSVRLLRIHTGDDANLADTVILHGSPTADSVHVSLLNANSVVAQGLSIPIVISGVNAADNLVVNGNGGADKLTADPGARALVNIGLFADPDPTISGAGSFRLPISYGTGKGPQSIAIGDLNADSIPDLVVAHSKGVSVLFGGGAGNFRAEATVFTGGTKPTGVVIGQFDGDADLDIAVTHAGSGTVAILLNEGASGFSDPALFKVGKGVNALRAARIDGDSTLDLVVANASGKVGVLLSNGDGTFEDAKFFATGGKGTRDLAIADFNGDGKADIAAANKTGNNIGVLIGIGDGTFGAAQKIKTANGPTALATGDFNGDGSADLVVTHAVGRFVSVLLGGGGSPTSAQFAAPINMSYPGRRAPIAVVSADLDKDGDLDLVLANQKSGSFSALLGLGDGTFAYPIELDLGNDVPVSPIAVAVADLNMDGVLDVVTVNQKANDVSVALRV